MAWVRLRTLTTPRRFRDSQNLLVNVACGHNSVEGWLNIDAIGRPGVDCVYDCRKRLPFPDGSARGIFCEHFLEHLDYTEEAQAFLCECLRVLAPGGVLRLVVPDAERYLRAYTDADWSQLEKIHPLENDHIDPYLRGRYNTKLELINVVFRQGHHHRFAYDFETLAFLLNTCGFSKVFHQSFGSCAAPDVCIDDPERAGNSLYADAMKS